MKERFDLEHWISMFPLKRYQEATAHLHSNLHPALPEVTSPFHVALLEQLRNKNEVAESVILADLGVFSLGEPEDPSTTKLGGIPFRDSQKPWPLSPEGFPMTFVGQLNFVDSPVPVSSLPGQILLVFAASTDEKATEMFWNQEELTDRFHFEWTDQTPRSLLQQHQLPETAWTFAAVHVQQWHATRDDGFVLSEASGGFDPESARFNLVGLKLGGFPIVDDFHPECDGTFLGCIPSVFPAYSPQYGVDIPYPFLNHPAPLFQGSSDGNLDFLCWGEGAVVNLFLDHGQVRAFVQGAS